MTEPDEVPIFEVRATLPDGSRQRLGLYASAADAAERARLVLATGQATRVETVKRVNGQVEVIAVAGPPSRFGVRRQPDRL